MAKSPDIDRGWAWVVLSGYFFTRFLVLGMSLSPGILYSVLLNVFKGSPAMIAWAVNLNTFMNYMASSVSNAAIKAMGSRLTIVTGCCISTAGLLATSFAPNLICVFIFYGLVTGFGYSMVNIASYPVVTSYFDKYQKIAILLASAGEGIGQFALPYIFLGLSRAYTWRGALMIIAGLNLNFLVVAAVYMPPRKETEKVEPGEKAEDQQRSSALLKINKVLAKCLKSFFEDLLLCRDYSFILLFGSYFFFPLGYGGMMTLVKTYGLYNGLTELEATTVLSFVGLFSLLGTIVIAFAMRHPKSDVLVIDAIFIIGVGICTASYGCVRRKTGYYILVAVTGVFTGCVAAFPVVIITVVGAQNVAAGISLISLAVGIGFISGGPIAARLYQFDPTYTTSFATMGVLIVLGAIMQIAIVWNHMCRNRKASEKRR